MFAFTREKHRAHAAAADLLTDLVAKAQCVTECLTQIRQHREVRQHIENPGRAIGAREQRTQLRRQRGVAGTVSVDPCVTRRERLLDRLIEQRERATRDR